MTVTIEPTLRNLSEAIFIANRHAKTATDNRYLYQLKQKAIEKLLEKGLAQKIGLHYSPNPGRSVSRSDVLVQIGDYFFHIPAKPEDYKTLPHLGSRDQDFKNPRPTIRRGEALSLLADFTGLQKEYTVVRSYKQPKYVQSVSRCTRSPMTSTYLDGGYSPYGVGIIKRKS
ncbi:hypothetical protein JK635_07465 [Neobacillus sp. YIM B02564]|uniref:YkyB-like protein n=1 Tax=Neobacillus paridis TaxID=2803862 RepID=A0ABS1TLA4_9BACI|nr:YkyB family protein [Neobacillus paridis]MBL4952047.1 hypothetical protein [Neobacillus paridis]